MNETSLFVTSTDVPRTAPEYKNSPIGVLDSGVGGLSILKELHQQLSHDNFVFYADQAHVPYGQKSLTQVQQYVEDITRFFLGGKFFDMPSVKLIVIACNTASAAALHAVRKTFPHIQFIGMEPAIKPAAQHTKTGHVGVIATAATFQGELYASLLDRYAQDVTVHKRACPEFVTLVERGEPYNEQDHLVVREALRPLVEADIDQLVLGCTHFPFLKSVLTEELNILGATVELIDPSPAVARQAVRVLQQADAMTTRGVNGSTIYFTSGDIQHFNQQIQSLTEISSPDVRGVE
jgi:glutamate racemase